MLKKFLYFLVRFANFNTLVLMIAISSVGLYKGAYKGEELKYYQKIGKTEKQIKYAQFSNIGTGVLQFVPVFTAFISKNPIMYLTHFGSLSIGCSICLVIKDLISETRPDDINNNRSFPSGHSVLAFCGASTLLLCLKKRKNIAIVGCFSVLLAISVAVCRVLANRHWWIDVIFGSIIGSFSTATIYYWMMYIKNNTKWFKKTIKRIYNEDV